MEFDEALGGLVDASGDPVFVRFRPDGVVHLLAGYDAYDDSAVAGLMVKQLARCGARGKPGQQYGISVFADEDLCGRCARLVPDGQRVRLFLHDVV